MARTYGRIAATIWADGDFLAMRGSAQRMFMFLISQPDLSHAGLLPMRVKRWSTKAEDLTAKSIRDDLTYLAGRDFIVVDEDTEEVLIRTMVRNDGVYKQPKVMLRMREDAQQIESPLLRAAFRQELERLPMHELNDRPGGVNADQPSTREQVEAVVNTLRDDFADAIRYPSPGVSDTHPDTPHVRAGAFPLPPTPTPVPHPPAPIPPTADGDEPPSRGLVIVGEVVEPAAQVTAQALVAEWLDHCTTRPPGSVIGQVSKQLKTMLAEDIDPGRLLMALAEWNAKGLHPSTLPSIVHEMANRKPRVGTKQQETDGLFERAAARMGVTGGEL